MNACAAVSMLQIYSLTQAHMEVDLLMHSCNFNVFFP